MTDSTSAVGKSIDLGLSHRAEIFRSKLIEEFQILETTSELGKRKVPVYRTTDILSKFVQEKQYPDIFPGCKCS